jgi:chromosome segregation ATPase
MLPERPKLDTMQAGLRTHARQLALLQTKRALTDADQQLLKQLAEDLAAKADDLRDVEPEILKLQDTVKETTAQVAAVERERDELRRDLTGRLTAERDKVRFAELRIADQIAELERLKTQFADSSKARPRIKVDDIVKQIREHVATLNVESVKAADAGKQSAVLIEKMEVEVRGRLDYEDGIRVTQAHPNEMTPESVSSIRFTLRPATTLRKVEP